jgi:hypothetical protein
MAEKFKVVRAIEIPHEGQVIDVTHLASRGREFIVGTVERVLDIDYYGPDEPPEVITFNGRRFVPET